MFPIKKQEALWAVRAVVECSRIAQAIQAESSVGAIKKSDRTPVTLADFSIQSVFAKRLQEAYPEDALVGEESSDYLRSPAGAATLAEIVQRVRPAIQATPESICEWIDLGTAEPGPRYWTLDPIDGTKGFLRGEHYAVALALIEDNEVTLGLLACPLWSLQEAGGTLVVAAKGEGAWACPLANTDQWQRLKTSTNASFDRARLLRSVEKEHTNVSQTCLLIERLGIQSESIQMDSAAKYAVLAAGEGDVFVRIPAQDKPIYREKIWDMAAGTLIVSEAGGTVTDIDGEPLDFFGSRSLDHNRGMLATNGLLHAQVLEALKKLDA